MDVEEVTCALNVAQERVSKSGFVVADLVAWVGSIQVSLNAALVDGECLLVRDDQLETGEFLKSWTKGFDNLTTERLIAVLAGDDREEGFVSW